MWKSWDISWKLSWTLMVWIGSYPWLKCQEINIMLKCWNMISKVIAGVRTYTSPYSTQCVVMFETSSGAWEHEEASARMECLVSQANRAFAVCGRICWDVFSFFFSKQANTRLYSPWCLNEKCFNLWIVWIYEDIHTFSILNLFRTTSCAGLMRNSMQNLHSINSLQIFLTLRIWWEALKGESFYKEKLIAKTTAPSIMTPLNHVEPETCFNYMIWYLHV